MRRYLGAVLDVRVHAVEWPERGREAGQRPGDGAKSAAGSSAFRAAPRWRAAAWCAPVRDRLTGGDPQLLADEVEPRDELRDRMLHLEPRVQLDEVEIALRPDEELERAGVDVADRATRALGGGLHLLALLGAERRRR